jgi:hypothetical protein
LRNGYLENCIALPTRQIGEHGERKFVVVRIKLLVGPWPSVTAEAMIDRMITIGCVRTRAGSQAYGQAARDQK